MIKGLSDRRRLPRLGKIHTGIKVRNAQGIEHPKATDYFVCPPEVIKVYNEKPKELKIMFPQENEEIWASQFYRCYSSSRGLVCKGDGETARMLVDVSTGNLATHDSQQTELKEKICAGRDCPHYGKQCREMMMLQFLLPDVPGLGIYQLDTGSINSMININSAIELIRSITGRISMIPLTLVLEGQEVSPEGKKKTVHVLNLRFEARLADLAKRYKALPGPVELPDAEDEVPELIIPEAQEAQEAPTKPPGAKIEASPAEDIVPPIERLFEVDPTATAVKDTTEKLSEFPMKNLGHFFSACLTKYNMNPPAVLKELGIRDKSAIGDIEEAWQTIQAVKGK
jgi:hypothetical protein